MQIQHELFSSNQHKIKDYKIILLPIRCSSYACLYRYIRNSAYIILKHLSEIKILLATKY